MTELIKSVLAAIATSPAENVVIVCITVFAIIVAALFALSRAGFIQIGSFTYRKEQEGQSTMHYMDCENSDADALMLMKLRQKTNALKQRILNTFESYDACDMTKHALTSAIRRPLYESVGNNHYTKELMPDRFDQYRDRMLTDLKDEYVTVCSSSSKTSCGNNELPDWKEAGPIIEQFLDAWLRDTANTVIDCCIQKLDVYRKYLPRFEESKDTYRITITNDCIIKNERYIAELARLTDSLNNRIESREEILAMRKQPVRS